MKAPTSTHGLYPRLLPHRLLLLVLLPLRCRAADPWQHRLATQAGQHLLGLRSQWGLCAVDVDQPYSQQNEAADQEGQVHAATRGAAPRRRGGAQR